MTYSMTGYGKASYQDGEIQAQLEIKSVNNRYLNVRISSPPGLGFLETEIQQEVARRFNRGSVDIRIFYRELHPQPSLHLNTAALHSLLAEIEDFKRNERLSEPVSVESLLLIPGMVDSLPVSFDEENCRKVIFPLLDQAIDQLLASRKEEGERLRKDLRLKLDQLEEGLQSVEQKIPLLAGEKEERLRGQLEKLLPSGLEVDQGLLENELALYAQKVDIDEEAVRLHSHITAFRETLSRQGAVGKALDFIVQEMNREVNTMASKSEDQAIKSFCLQQKVGIEKIREQIQNLE